MTIAEIIISSLSFLNNNPGLMTLLVGGFAIYLYLKQKADYKRNAAKLILQEIRYAEQQIRNAKTHEDRYYLADKLLPTNSWHANIHLFVEDLKEIEIDLISRFYSHSSYLDIVIEKVSDKKNDIMVPVSMNPSAPVQKSDNANIPIPIQTFQLNADNILKEVSDKIEFIYNTPAIDKLRIISEKKWHQLF